MGNGTIRGQKALGMPGRLKPLHTILTLPRGAMRVFAAVIEITTLPVFHPGRISRLAARLAQSAKTLDKHLGDTYCTGRGPCGRLA